MKLVILLCATILAATAVPSQLHLEQFQQFKLQHGKTYGSPEEEQLRLKIFSENLKKIEEHNARYEQGLETYEMGVNQFTDLTSEEFGKYLTLQGPPPELEDASLYEPSNVNAPDSIDWRQKGAVTPVKSQGACNSCWSFSVTGATESAVFLATKRLISLSEQNLIDCDHFSAKCASGTMFTAFNYIKSHGIASESSYPYEARNGTCRPVPPVVTIKALKSVPRNENFLRNTVGTVGPVAVALDGIPFQTHKGGVFHNVNCNSSNLNHAGVVVGYGNDGQNDYWILKNSWGSSWGEGGYIRLIRNYNNHCGIISMSPMFPVV